ncbi:hypothetical protein PALB_25060 [Pseudoalteromonas luteoviolacea B = ATCC 29581]|nr:hypothetical protein PALB_25060 [Pseudoalteromonas luteoviolacea B = ATCC 29581]
MFIFKVMDSSNKDDATMCKQYALNVQKIRKCLYPVYLKMPTSEH